MPIGPGQSPHSSNMSLRRSATYLLCRGVLRAIHYASNGTSG